MFKVLLAAGALALASTPVLADATGDLVRASLYSGSFADGLAKLSPLAASGDPEAAFGVGAIKLSQAIEGFTRTLWQHGFQFPDTHAAFGEGTPLRLPVNPSAQPFDYDGVRTMLSDLVAGLDDARAAFDAAGKSGDYVIDINPLLIRIDVNGDGKGDADESIAGFFALMEGATVNQILDTPPTPAMAKFDYFGFDRADAYWFAGYTQIIAAQADFLLAHDFSDFVNVVFHRLFPQAGFPMQDYAMGGTLMMDPQTDTGIADAVAAIHSIDWPVIDPARLAGVRTRLKAVLAYSRQDWDAILAETDNDHELVPSPKQTTILPGASVDDARVAAWRETLDKADAVLDGTLLIPHWRFKQGFDLKAYFETAKRTDLVLMLTGYGALPYLKAGPVATHDDFGAVQTAFGNDWLGYAFWFN